MILQVFPGLLANLPDSVVVPEFMVGSDATSTVVDESTEVN